MEWSGRIPRSAASSVQSGAAPGQAAAATASSPSSPHAGTANFQPARAPGTRTKWNRRRESLTLCDGANAMRQPHEVTPVGQSSPFLHHAAAARQNLRARD